eukprot:CAMPEP_0113453604 /NCGR_PEP_ID=MMETSP0014_2-20120614/7439_1 /TAXON_ID=2857 /ORGANISM="Nitzschia sp." /LENGTH=157 /DNA_ID=CAMNT_0000344995 /DNA_START=13 /DNA_END=486 /DNA_ORIENTATION=+ /assembly_acc=CAM_ASM_000159
MTTATRMMSLNILQSLVVTAMASLAFGHVTSSVTPNGCSVVTVEAFTTIHTTLRRLPAATATGTGTAKTVTFMSSDPDDNNSKLKNLGFTDDEIRRSSTSVDARQEPQKVRVDLVEKVDSVTLTAIGFGLIAFNFFVLANMGDGGIAGIVARIINTF